jgi:hypothetical protein
LHFYENPRFILVILIFVTWKKLSYQLSHIQETYHRIYSSPNTTEGARQWFSAENGAILQQYSKIVAYLLRRT